MKTIPVIIPPLVLILEAREREKGTPLTEAEVLKIRDEATAVALEEADFWVFWADRAKDVDPNNVWDHWQRYRATGVLTYPSPPSH